MICSDGPRLLATVALCTTLFAVTLCPAPAIAHSSSVSYSVWTLSENGGQAQARVPQRELSRAGLLPEAPDYLVRVAEFLTRGVVLGDDQAGCRPDASSSVSATLRDGHVHYTWSVSCEAQPSRLISHLPALLNNSHSHFLTVHVAGATTSKVLTTRDPGWSRCIASGASAAPSNVWGFGRLGINHIFGGWDHLLFLLALVVLARSLREVAWLATGFTVGHSLTLAIAVLGLARPVAGVVETLIALSIVALALENGWRMAARGGRSSGELAAKFSALTLAALLLAGWAAGALPAEVVAGLAVFMLAYLLLLRREEVGFRWRLALTAAFGLFHGFGFAGLLTSMQLEPGYTATALLGFNLGVEAGQLLLLVLVWPLLHWAKGRGWPAPEAITFIAAGAGVGAYFVRVFA